MCYVAKVTTIWSVTAGSVIDCVDSEGNVDVPNGIGLGVEYDWDYINKNTTDLKIFE